MPSPHCRSSRSGSVFTWKWFPAALVGSVLAGCATVPPPPQPNLAASIGLPPGAPVTIGVLQPNITLRELGAGGSPQERDDWSDTARETARETLESLRPEKFVYFRDEEVSPEVKAEIVDVQALFETTILNDMAMLYPPTRGRPNFGSVDSIAAAVGADALLIVYGVDDIFTADRKVLTALSVVAAGLTGVSVMPGNGEAHLNAALIARDGRLIWYSRIYQDQIADLRTPEGVRKTLEHLLRTMPTTQAAAGSASAPPT